MESSTVVLCDFNECVFVCLYCGPLCVKYLCHVVSCCVYAGSSMEFQCFEIQIKTEADNNECSHDDKPSTGMFAVSDNAFCAVSWLYCLICFYL